MAHSNPNDVTQSTDYLVTLQRSTPTLTANLTPVFYDNSMATNAVTGATVQLGPHSTQTSGTSLMPEREPHVCR